MINTWNVYSSWALDIFIEKVAIAQFEANTYFMQLWDNKKLPRGSNSYKFNIVDAWTLSWAWAITTEWVAPSETAFTMKQVAVTMTQLWAYTKFTDVVLLDSPVDVISNAWKELWRLLAEQADTSIQTVLATWSNVLYAWDATSTDTIDASDVVAATNLADVFSKLKANRAPSYNWEWYVSVMHPLVINDLMKDTAHWNFIEVAKYSSPEKVFKWEIWKLFWVRIIESANVTTNVDAWDSKTDTYNTYVMWEKAYWVVSSQNLEMTIKMPWSAWTADPLNQTWTVWGKMRFWAALLKEESLFRIESAASLWNNS